MQLPLSHPHEEQQGVPSVQHPPHPFPSSRGLQHMHDEHDDLSFGQQAHPSSQAHLSLAQVLGMIIVGYNLIEVYSAGSSCYLLVGIAIKYGSEVQQILRRIFCIKRTPDT